MVSIRRECLTVRGDQMGGGGGGNYDLDSGWVGMVSFGRNHSLITRCLVC